MRKVLIFFVFAALVPTAGQATSQQGVQTTVQQAKFDVPVTNTANYQTFCPDQPLDSVIDFFEKPKELGGYLASGQYFTSGSESSVEVEGEKITHQAPRIAVVYFFKEGTDQGRKGTFILAKGFFDQSRSGRWQPMIAVSPRSLDGDVCYTLKN
jgi:hypothetical protein